MSQKKKKRKKKQSCKIKTNQLSNNQFKILKAIERYGLKGVNLKQISNYMGWPQSKIRISVYSLLGKGYITTMGTATDEETGKKFPILRIK